LSKAQHWTVHPPAGLIPGVGVVVFEHNPTGTAGKIIMIGDNDMYTNPQTWNKHNITVDIPQWEEFILETQLKYHGTTMFLL
jgi:hypothetical protein